MNDMTSTDMTGFLQRHDRRSRRLFIAMVCASLVVSVVIFVQGVQTRGSPAALGKLWFPILVYPLFLTVFSIGVTLWSRRQPRPPGGRFVMNPDDARNVARVANGGFVFVVGLAVVSIASQASMALGSFGALKSLYAAGDWTGRAILVANGGLMMYFGNAWSRMPTPRAPAQKPATQMKYKRVLSWLIVIHGLVMALAALLLPIPAMIAAVVVVSVSMVLSLVASVAVFRNALKSPSAA